MESILSTIKKLLGISETYTHFDQDIRIHIDTVFGALTQIGIGPKEGFYIEDASTVWYDYTDSTNLEMIKTYIYLKVRLMFDPPASSVLLESINNTIKELEFRLLLEGEKPNSNA